MVKPTEASSMPVAVVGVGCRFPGGDGKGAFWDLVREGRNAFREVPADRWPWSRDRIDEPAIRRAAFVDDVAAFDPHFFRMSEWESDRTDPQQRIAYEVAWEALEDAGLDVRELAGRDVGVFVGISNADFALARLVSGAGIDSFTAIGGTLSIVANRLSYLFDLRGPSLAVDTACSSSLVALHLACRAIQNGDASMALVGGVSVMQSPNVALAMHRLGALSPDGECRPFDRRGAGYVRGEGAGFVVLKPFDDAVPDGDRIYAVVRGSAVGHNGSTRGIAAPRPLAQEAVIRTAFARAGMDPRRAQYIEAHGTATVLGDRIELAALARVLGNRERSGEAPFELGAVKANVGHLEPAAGIAGFIKVCLALEHETIPPIASCEQPTPHLPAGCAISNVARPWLRSAEPRLAGVSSFGFGGANCHVVLTDAAPPEASPHAGPDAARKIVAGLHLVVVSAHSSSALEARVAAVAETLEREPDRIAAHVATLACRRTHLPYRIAVVAGSAADAVALLRRRVSDGSIRAGAARTIPTSAMVLRDLPGPSAGEKLASELGAFGTLVTNARAVAEEVLGSARAGEAQVQSSIVGWAFVRLMEQLGLGPDVVFAHGRGEELAVGLFSSDEPRAMLDRLVRAVPGSEDASGRVVRASEDAAATSLDADTWFARRIRAQAGSGPVLAYGLDRGAAPSDPWVALDELDLAAVLRFVAAAYEAGAAVQFRALFDGPQPPTELPRYPWRHRACALVPPAAESLLAAQYEATRSIALGSQHDMERSMLERPASTTEARDIELTMPVRQLAGQHRYRGAAIFPGAYFVELAYGELANALSSAAGIELRDLHFAAPLTLDRANHNRVRFALKHDATTPEFELSTVPKSNTGAVVHATGRAAPFSGVSEVLDADIVAAVTALEQASGFSEVAFDERAAARYDFEYGPALRNVRRLVIGPKGEAFAWLALQKDGPRDHVVTRMLDAAFQAFGLALEELRDLAPSGAYVPSRIGRFANAGLGGEAICRVRRIRLEARAVVADVDFFHKDGQWAAAADGVTLSALAVPAPIYRARWTKERREPAPVSKPASWLLLVDPGEDTRAARLAFGEHGRSITVHETTDKPEEFFDLLRGASGYEGIAVLWGLRDDANRDLPEREEARVARLISLTRVVAKVAMTHGSRVYVVTRRTQSDETPGDPARLAGAAFWGIGRAIGTELPALWGGLADVDTGDAPEWGVLARTMVAAAGSPAPLEVRVRGGELRELDVERVPDTAVGGRPGGPPAVSGDGVALVTGAGGKLGAKVVRWLVASGARRVLALARREPSPEWRAQMQSLERMGAEVVVRIGDVTNLESLRTAIAGFESSLSSVYHLAGVLEDQLILKSDPGAVARVLAPKVRGAYNVHELTRSLPGVRVVFFSSAAAIFPAPGQAAYAAGNAFVDAVARSRRGSSLRGLSINWGPWAEGMAAAVDPARWSAMGIKPLESGDALGALRAILETGEDADIVVARPTDPSQAWKRPSAPTRDAARGPAAPRATSILAELRELGETSPRRQREAAVEYLRKIVADILQVEEAEVETDVSLARLGLDSMAATELRERLTADLNQSIPYTLAFENPTVEALADFLLEEMLGVAKDGSAEELARSNEPAKAAGPSSLDAMLDEIRSMPEAEAEYLLREDYGLSDAEIRRVLEQAAQTARNERP